MDINPRLSVLAGPLSPRSDGSFDPDKETPPYVSNEGLQASDMIMKTLDLSQFGTARADGRKLWKNSRLSSVKKILPLFCNYRSETTPTDPS